MTPKIKLFDPFVGKQEEKIMAKVLQSHFWASGSGVGYVSKFEYAFKKYAQSKDCIAVNSGTAALHLALSLIDIKNKEVILPSLTFVATANAVIQNGGKPVFVDVDPNTMCIDPEKILHSITKKTKVILPVHFGGFPSNLDMIQELCKKHNLILVEDAAHAAGANYNGKKIGSHGNFVCFSFHPVKNLAMPTGGLISINEKNFKQSRKILESRRWCGITKRNDVNYDVEELGWNFYMNEFSAAIGLEQLKKLDRANKIRKKIAKKYSKNINSEFKMPFDHNCSYHFFWLMVKKRDNFRKNMKNAGIETGIHYKPIHHMSMYKNLKSLPITDNANKEIVSIPTHPNLSEKDIEYIITNVNKFL